MKTDNSRPREGWIYDNGEWFGSVVSETELTIDDFEGPRAQKMLSEVVHVVERSALDAANARIAELEHEAKIKDETYNMVFERKKRAEAERDQAVADAKAALQALDALTKASEADDLWYGVFDDAWVVLTQERRKKYLK